MAACDVPADVAGRTFSRFCCVFSDPAVIGCDSGDGEVRRFEASTEVLEDVRGDGVGAVVGRCCALVPGLLGEESCRACHSSVSLCIIKITIEGASATSSNAEPSYHTTLALCY